MEKEKLDVVALIEKTPITRLNNIYNNKYIERIKTTFTNTEQQMFLGSFYCYLNYDPEKDFVVNLEKIWKWLGFSRKEECKRVLTKHFNKDIDYKIVFRRSAENLNDTENNTYTKKSPSKNIGGRPKETILLNIKTFKKLCLKSNTKKADEIHDYFIRLEEMLQEILLEEAKELQQQLDEHKNQLRLLQNKPPTHGFGMNRPGYIYLINDLSKPGHYKIGMATNTKNRLRNLNTSSSEKSLRLYFEIETYDAESLERTIHFLLIPFNIKGRREWFYFSDEDQVQYAMSVMKDVKTFFDHYHFKSFDHFTNRNNNDNDFNDSNNDDNNDNNNEDSFNDNNDNHNDYNNDKNDDYNDNNETCCNKELVDDIRETNIYKLTGQQLKNKTGNYKGVFWTSDKSKWRAALKKDYKEFFLGYFDTELEGAKVYNDYAMYLNKTENTNYLLNDIPNYKTTPRDVVAENETKVNDLKTSKYHGVCYDTRRNYYAVSIKYKKKSYHLGHNTDQLECAKIYNQQALYYNNTFGTKYPLNDIPNYITVPKNIYKELQQEKILKKSSKYYGVSFSKQCNKYKALIVENKKQLCLGLFVNEIDAAKAYNKKAIELNNLPNSKHKYKLNETF